MPPVSPALRRALAVATRHHGLITTAQCEAVGLSRQAAKRLVDRGAWTREARGLYRVAGTPRTWNGRALAAALSAGESGLVSHRSACHLWRLQGFRRPVGSM
jgi:predicted transcriptional regulator of viral defense system